MQQPDSDHPTRLRASNNTGQTALRRTFNTTDVPPSSPLSERTPIMQRSPSSPQSVPQASVGRMLLSPFVRVIRILRLPVPTNIPTSPTSLFSTLFVHIFAALKRLDTSVDPRKTLGQLSNHEFTIANSANFGIMFALALSALYIMDSVFLKIFIPVAYTIGLLLPITCQFVFPATYILSWLLVFFTSRFIPSSWRPSIHVVLLPTLESVLYGANISDLLTRYTHPVLDIIAWLPYGVIHFIIPFVVAAILWVFCPKGSVQFWAKAFGLMMLWGVLVQLLLPTAAPCESDVVSIWSSSTLIDPSHPHPSP